MKSHLNNEEQEKLDKLEKFVHQNREAFDDAEPSPQLWVQLEQRLAAEGKLKNGPASHDAQLGSPPASGRDIQLTAQPTEGRGIQLEAAETPPSTGSRAGNLWNNVWVWRAAAVVLLGVCLALIVGRPQPGAPTVVADDKPLSLPEELAQTEWYFKGQIETLEAELASYQQAGHAMEDAEVFARDMAELEALYTQLKEELNVTNDEVVFGVMVQNLQLQIEVLTRQVNLLRQLQQEQQGGAGEGLSST